MAVELPEHAKVVWTIEVCQFLGDDGELHMAFDIDGIARESAIGFLTVVQDRIREERSFQWDTCPGCLKPWDEHEDESE